MDMESLRIFQEERALEVLLILFESPGILKSELYAKMESNGSARQTAIKRTNANIAAGLIRIEASKTHKAGQYLFLTDQGERIAELALKMKAVMAGEDGETNYGTSPKSRS